MKRKFKKILIVLSIALIIIWTFALYSTEAAVSRPRLTVSKYSINPDPAIAGKPFELSLLLKNVGDRDAKSIDIRLNNVEGKPTLGNFSPLGSSNHFYIEELEEEKDYSKKLRLTTNERIESGTYNLILTIQYGDSSSRTYNEQAILGISVLRIPEIKIEGLSYPEEIKDVITNKEENGPRIKADIVNASNFQVNAVGVELLGDLEVDNFNQYIGVLEAGGFDTFEAKIQDTKPGTYQEELTVTYRNDFGQEEKIVRKFKIKINEDGTEQAARSLWQRIIDFIRALFGVGK